MSGPLSGKRIVLSAHFDSKVYDEFSFVAATDSAVPCAYLLAIARTFAPLLDVAPRNRRRLQFVFFDGEEAFDQWTNDDSLYGSRHLAARWKAEDRLRDIALLTLFDLMGHAGAQFLATDARVNNYFDALRATEKRIQDAGLAAVSLVKPLFSAQRAYNAAVDDDHRPFKDLVSRSSFANGCCFTSAPL